jgi:uncharacterized membrane protein
MPKIVEQAVVERMMPLGNETDMTEEERDRLGAWAEAEIMPEGPP